MRDLVWIREAFKKRTRSTINLITQSHFVRPKELQKSLMSREYMIKKFRKIIYKRSYIFLVHLLRTSGDKRSIEMWRILNSLIFNLTKNVLAWCGHGHYETLTSGTGLIRCLSCTLNENQESFGVLGLLHLLADFQIENSVE